MMDESYVDHESIETYNPRGRVVKTNFSPLQECAELKEDTVTTTPCVNVPVALFEQIIDVIRCKSTCSVWTDDICTCGTEVIRSKAFNALE